MTNEQWEECRTKEGAIELKKAFTEALGKAPTWGQADYLEDVEFIQPIKSRQAAAVAIAMAQTIK